MTSAEIRNKVLQKLEELEGQNASIGRYDFISLDDLSAAASIDPPTLIEVLGALQEERQVIWDKSAGVKSRIGHILFVLRNSEVRYRNKPPLRNVSDLKYIRYVKQIPRYYIDLTDVSVRDQLDGLLKFSESEEKSGAIISPALSAISTQYPKVSKFQMNSTLEILRRLTNPGQKDGIVIVADTGGGKSFAYQFPLFLWILTKKIHSYLTGSNTNCAALLVFPRNVLAEDQWEDLTSLAQVIQRRIEQLNLPSDFKQLLNFRIKRDFGGSSTEKVSEIYSNMPCPDIVVTNTETMKRRLMNPVAHELYRNGIDFVLYDEIHLYSGLHGAYVAGLNARLKTLLPVNPVFVGMSATIAKPEKHCQKLFALQERATLISDRDDILENRVIEHHVILKPRPGRSPLGVTVDATSSLLHNRRDGMSSVRGIPAEQRPKTICFSDSLDTSGRWALDQNNLELFDEPTPIPPSDFYRGYPFYYRPASRPNAQPSFGEACVDCHEGRDVICSACEHYTLGRCWWFSQDSGEAGRWRALERSPNLFIPDDNIRSKRLTGQEYRLEHGNTIYDLYRTKVYSPGRANRQPLQEVDADSLIATNVLEVGVDFKGIKEIVMFGEIASPANYKQKAGRGAREGNTENGLFVMTIVPAQPLANFYYRHFRRLVNPSLTPIPLEPSNPDALKSHAFASVLDYLAKRQIDVFNIIEAKKDPAAVETEFRKALDLIHNQREAVEEHVVRFLKLCGIEDGSIVTRSVDEVVRILEDWFSEVEIDGQSMRFVTWIFLGSRDGSKLRSLSDKVKNEYEKAELRIKSLESTQEQLAASKSKLDEALARLPEQYREVAEEVKRFPV